MNCIKAENNSLKYFCDNETVLIQPWGHDSFRIRATRLPELPGNNWALLKSESSDESIITVTENEGIIANGKIKAKISRHGQVSIYSGEKPIMREYLRNWAHGIDKPYASALGITAREFSALSGGNYKAVYRLESLGSGEKIFGMGQYQQPQLNLKGTVLELAQRNSQASVPFAVSSLGYGFLWNNPAVGRVTFGTNITVWEADISSVIDFWITAGDTPRDILKNYSQATGKPPMMPEYALGFWQSKLRYETQEELLSVAREYKARNLPLSVIVCDFFHWTQQGDWKFDPEYWPSPDKMVAELRDMGIELLVSVWPTVSRKSKNYEEMLKSGFLTRTEHGLRYSFDFDGCTIHFDATNPKARAYLWQKIKQNYTDKGVKMFWLDEAEPEYTVYDFANYRYYIGSNSEAGNIYPLHFAQCFFEGQKSAGLTEIVNLVRCAWAGSQRYGALVWSGDIPSTFASMKNQLSAALNLGLAGIPWWTSDIGGFFGGCAESPSFKELLARWFAWGAFCPVMRLHGDRLPKKQHGTNPNVLALSGADNEVWSFGSEVYEICKKYLQTRENIKPYLAQVMREAHLTGAPVMRTLFFEFPDDEAAWNTDNEYMLGADLLVAPVTEASAICRSVYLPKGCDWLDVYTGEKISGDAHIRCNTPLDKIPLYCRADAKSNIYELLNNLRDYS